MDSNELEWKRYTQQKLHRTDLQKNEIQRYQEKNRTESWHLDDLKKLDCQNGGNGGVRGNDLSNDPGR